MTTPHFDSRVVRILWWLLEQDSPRSTDDLAAALGFSARIARYRFAALDAVLGPRDITLERRRGRGVWLEGSPEALAALRAELAGPLQPQPLYTPHDRAQIMLATLLWASPQSLTLDKLSSVLGASKTSLSRSLDWCQRWLLQHRLSLDRQPGSGTRAVGSELDVRLALVAQIISVVPHAVLDELVAGPFEHAIGARMRIPIGMREHLSRLPLRESAPLVSRGLFDGALDEAESERALVVYLAVAAARISAGKPVTFGRRQADVPPPQRVSDIAAAVAGSFTETFGFALDAAEHRALAHYLLGLSEISHSNRSTSAEHSHLVRAMLEAAAGRLSASLASDAQLHQSLCEHVDRLEVRLRHGLPIHNPFLARLNARYPEVHQVAVELASMMAEALGAPVSDDEVGFVTMYLSGALEQSRTRRRRAVVVCHSGMASAWVLVARLKAEFPELEIADVVSAGACDDLDLTDVDVVVSTVDLSTTPAMARGVETPVSVVSPLLESADVEVIASTL